jgi:uncharacterized protein (DUF433 family)
VIDLEVELVRREAKMQANWREYVVSSPDVLRGKPRMKGTRISVGLILGYLAADKSVEEIIGEFPELEKQHIIARLNYARDLTEYEVAV